MVIFPNFFFSVQDVTASVCVSLRLCVSLCVLLVTFWSDQWCSLGYISPQLHASRTRERVAPFAPAAQRRVSNVGSDPLVNTYYPVDSIVWAFGHLPGLQYRLSDCFNVFIRLHVLYKDGQHASQAKPTQGVQGQGYKGIRIFFL